MGLFDRLMGRELPERKDARRIYFRLLEQSRDPVFFGFGKFADDYDGRIDVISLHMAVIMERLRAEGSDGNLLNQALFDEMKDDFEIALREEGISDTGVKKRIKPMIGHFYDRLKAYTEALQSDQPHMGLSESFRFEPDSATSSPFAAKVAHYAADLLEGLKSNDFKDIRHGRFYFPDL